MNNSKHNLKYYILHLIKSLDQLKSTGRSFSLEERSSRCFCFPFDISGHKATFWSRNGYGLSCTSLLQPLTIGSEQYCLYLHAGNSIYRKIHGWNGEGRSWLSTVSVKGNDVTLTVAVWQLLSYLTKLRVLLHLTICSTYVAV